MNAPAPAIVVTTIQESTACLSTLARRARSQRLPLIVIGDRKGPRRLEVADAEFVSIGEQQRMPFSLARALPENHYARKNLGYLLAMSRGCECIYETDDDNAPTDAWGIRTLDVSARRLRPMSTASWANIYSAYTDELIWPRGMPLDAVRRRFHTDFLIEVVTAPTTAPIQQGLANGAPDVDAVWRLVLDREIRFVELPPVVLPRGVWCPFNSQNTWWWKPAFPLLYLPSHCSFRMTDIWRSFVAQRCLWEMGYEVEFHGADVAQLRNEHDYVRDFELEIPGYLRNEEIRRALTSCELARGADCAGENLLRCYETLVGSGIVSAEELFLLRAWLDDCAALACLGGPATTVTGLTLSSPHRSRGSRPL